MESFSRGTEIHMFTFAPDWNGKTFCGVEGYKPTAINAPSISYSGMLSDTDLVEPIYNFIWQQKINDGEWAEVSSIKSSKFIDSYEPPILFNKKQGSPILHYVWRLKVTDLSNSNQSVISDEFDLFLVSSIASTYEIKPSKSNNQYAVNLIVNGGGESKKYHWSNLNSNVIINDEKANLKNPGKLSAGIYQIVINDGVCPATKLIVDTSSPPLTSTK